MSQCMFVFMFVLLFAFDKRANCDDNLLGVVTIFRHGDRTPTKSFPNDIYFKESYWPMGYGELTNVGKTRMYELGKWLRRRYNSFLPDVYSPRDIFVKSTNRKRCLMSASAVLTGLFPPKDPLKLNDMQWQHIHTLPNELDEVLAMRKPCPKFQRLLNETLTSEFINKTMSKCRGIFSYISKYSGWSEVTLGNVATLHVNLEIYDTYNKSFIPPWTKPLRKILAYLAGVDESRYTLTHILKRLLTGPFWAHLLAHFDNLRNGTSDTPKFLVLSAHDITLVSILNCLGLYNFVPPYFGDALIWEMRVRADGVKYINLFYKRLEKTTALRFMECGLNCSYEGFKRTVAPLVVHGRDWEIECEIVPTNSTTKHTQVSNPFLCKDNNTPTTNY